MRPSRRWFRQAASAALVATAMFPAVSPADERRTVPDADAAPWLAGAPTRPRVVAPRLVAPRALVGRELVLEVLLNGVPLDPGAVLRVMPDGTVLVAVEDANRWRLRFDEFHLIDSGGVRFLPLRTVAGLRLTLDERAAVLRLVAPPSALTASSLAIDSGPSPQPSDLGLGAFLNYDVLVQDSTAATSSGGQFRFGVFDGFGVLTSEHAVSDGSVPPRRLMTTLRKDDPSGMTTWRFGDFFSAPGSIGRTALMGGVQWGTNFSLQPSLVTFPFQSLDGEAALPSTVEVYVNGALRNTIDAPPGPFEIGQIPVITGAGTLRMVVTDSLGRRVVVEQSFFASNRMLRQGLHEQSWELGALREDFGTESNHYGRPAAVTTHRFGVSDWLTTEFRAELLEDQQTVGGGLTVLAGDHGFWLADAAYGRVADQDGGAHGSVGFQGQWGAFSLGTEVEGAEAGFVQIGDGTTTLPSMSTASVALGWFGEVAGSFGLALVRDKPRGGPDSEVANLSWSLQVGRGGNLALSYFEDFAQTARRGAALTYSLGFDAHHSVSATVSHEEGTDPRLVLQAQRALGRGPGWGWRVQADREGDGSVEASLQTDYGLYRAGADRNGSETRSYLGATGGLTWVANNLLASRRIENAFGLVRVPGMAGVRVYFDNELVGVTDADGDLLLPALRPYQANEVRIDVQDLPLDAVLPVERLSGVPYFGSGVVLVFPVRVERAATLTLVDAKGAALPAGASVRVGSDTPSPIGDGGYAFIAAPAGRSTLTVDWEGGGCTATIDVPAAGEPLPDLGRVICNPSTPR